jgi:hypothetical protein
MPRIATKAGDKAASKDEKEHYIVVVKTGQSKSVGDVYLSLYGTNANIERFHLKESKSKKKPFVGASRDEFEFSGSDVGNV